ncbi:hypothetical protein ACTA71_009637 [Dictyostelium dimigraforme]
MTTLSKIGSARDERFNKNHFNFMYDKALSLKEKGLNKDILTLVSGGAAWSDHVAIRLFLNYLDIQFKIIFTIDSGNGENKELKISTIGEIIKAKEMGAILDFTSGGFHSRNKKVAHNQITLLHSHSQNLLNLKMVVH